MLLWLLQAKQIFKTYGIFSLFSQQVVQLFSASDPFEIDFNQSLPEATDGIFEVVMINHFAHQYMICSIIALLFTFMTEAIYNGYPVYNLLRCPLYFTISTKFIVPDLYPSAYIAVPARNCYLPGIIQGTPVWRNHPSILSAQRRVLPKGFRPVKNYFALEFTVFGNPA